MTEKEFKHQLLVHMPYKMLHFLIKKKALGTYVTRITKILRGANSLHKEAINFLITCKK